MNIIMEYLLNEKKMTEVVAEKTEEKIIKYDDIHNDFKLWLERRTFTEETSLMIEGYTAKDIQNLAPFMDGLGVYTFMVTLRDNPEKAKEYIASGFMRK